ncbi:MAG: hypothetical protein ACQESG_06305 [Nanobdellota archaeon]
MVLSYYSPAWFYGYDILLESSFAIIALIVALFAFRIFRETRSHSVKLFGVAFSFISVSYIIQSVFNFIILKSLTQATHPIVKMHTVAIFENIGHFIHIIFFIIGIAILLYTTLKANSRVLWLLILLSLGITFIGSLYMFFFISSVYLAFISWHYLQHFLKKRNWKRLLVAFAFIFLLFGHFHFLIAVDHQLFYVIGHILEFFAYILIAINLYLVYR